MRGKDPYVMAGVGFAVLVIIAVLFLASAFGCLLAFPETATQFAER